MADPAALDSFDATNVPNHIAIIMDGNGRWATARGLPRTEGHKRGEDALFEAVEGCLASGVKWMTVYAFSTENWRRPKDEVKFLLNYSRGLLRRRRDELNDRGVRIRFVGRRDWRVPRGVLNEMDKAESLTVNNDKMTLVIAFNYGGRAEIVDAMRAMVDEGLKGKQITEKAIARHLYDPEMPDPEVPDPEVPNLEERPDLGEQPDLKKEHYLYLGKPDPEYDDTLLLLYCGSGLADGLEHRVFDRGKRS